MLVSDIIKRVRSTAGDVAVLQFTDEDIINWINDGVRECAINNNLLQKRATSSLTVGQSEYNIPIDILKLHSVKVGGEKLKLITLNEFEDRYSDATPSATGSPTVGYMWAGKIVMYPAPDEVKSLAIDYIYNPNVITNDESGKGSEPPLPVGYHSRLVDYCLAQVAQQDDDLNRYQMKMQEFQTGVQALKDQPEWNYDVYPSMAAGPFDDMWDF